MVAKTVLALKINLEIPQEEENFQPKRTRQHSFFSAKTKTKNQIRAKSSNLVLNIQFF